MFFPRSAVRRISEVIDASLIRRQPVSQLHTTLSVLSCTTSFIYARFRSKRGKVQTTVILALTIAAPGNRNSEIAVSVLTILFQLMPVVSLVLIRSY